MPIPITRITTLAALMLGVASYVATGQAVKAQSATRPDSSDAARRAQSADTATRIEIYGYRRSRCHRRLQDEQPRVVRCESPHRAAEDA